MELLKLKWECHNKIFQNAIGKLCGKDEYTDITLFCCGRLFRAHKIVLSACSDFFKDLFDQLQYTIKDPIIVLSNIAFNILEFILNYIYIGEVVVPSNELDSLVTAAKFLRIKGLIADEVLVPESNYLFERLSIGNDQSLKETYDKDTSPIFNDNENSFSRCNNENSFSICNKGLHAFPVYESQTDVGIVTPKLDSEKGYAKNYFSQNQDLEREPSKNVDIMMEDKGHSKVTNCSSRTPQSEGLNLLDVSPNLNLISSCNEIAHLNEDALALSNVTLFKKKKTMIEFGEDSDNAMDSLVIVDNVIQQSTYLNAFSGGDIKSEEFSAAKVELGISSSENISNEAENDEYSNKFSEDDLENIENQIMDNRPIKKELGISSSENISNDAENNETSNQFSENDLENIEDPIMNVRPGNKEFPKVKLKNVEVVLKRINVKTSSPREKKKGKKKSLKNLADCNAASSKTICGKRRRRQRCGQCEGCLATSCKECIYCKDKYEKLNRLRQRCIKTRCKYLQPKQRLAKFNFESMVKQNKTDQNMSTFENNNSLDRVSLKCKFCDSTSLSKRDYLVHLKKVHNGRTLKCRYCSFKTNLNLSLKSHERAHVLETPIILALKDKLC